MKFVVADVITSGESMKTMGRVGDHTTYMMDPKSVDGSIIIIVTRGDYTVTLKVSPETQPFDVKQEWETRNE